MNARFLPIILSLGLSSLCAFATDVSGDVSGTWTLAGSPYNLVGDVQVPADQTLRIEPGVVINALGLYAFTVGDGAILIASGTPEQPILFTAQNQTTGWRGLRLDHTRNDTIVSHCILEYAKPVGDWQEVRGGAIRIVSCSPTVAHCELRYNLTHNANANGGGAGVMTTSSNALIVGNYFHHNTSDSGAAVCSIDYGTPRLIGNLITDNTAYAGGGGIYCGVCSSPLIERNVILRNWAGQWGGGGINSWTSYIFYGTYATIRDNVIAKNVTPSGSNASGGGGIYCRYDRAIITNNTIADNQAGQGGGIYALNYPPQAPLVSNCILWGNTATSDGHQIYLNSDTGSAIAVNFSDIEDGWPGDGNLAEDPQFASPASDDYHLLATSPCVDVGDPAFIPALGETDLDGQMRVWDDPPGRASVVDLGADEYGSFVYADLNCDGVVNFDDINAFVLALAGPGPYQAQYPDCNWRLADCNADGAVTFDDINPFVDMLSAVSGDIPINH